MSLYSVVSTRTPSLKSLCPFAFTGSSVSTNENKGINHLGSFGENQTFTLVSKGLVILNVTQ